MAPNQCFQTLFGAFSLFLVMLWSTYPSQAQAQVLATSESPQQGSFESGVGLIRGWVCDAEQVQVSIDGGPLRPTAYGTKRGDTVAVCDDDNNGFGLTFNWNNIGDGVHNLRALADGLEFANVNFVITTLGADFLTGLSGEYTLADFPNNGNTVTVGWAEPHQNFVFISPVTIPGNPSPPTQTGARLESPTQGSFESGVGLIRGWVCDANLVEVSIDGGPLRPTAYGTKRGDTVAVCGDDNNGFGLTFNWNSLGDGVHNVRALADGVAFADVNFAVTTLGADFLTGVSGDYTLPDFPQTGNTTTVRWTEPHQNFFITRSTTTSKIATAAAVTDPLNPMAVIGVGTDLGDALGIKVAKGDDGKPTLLLGLDWGTLDEAFWVNLLFAANGLPERYVDSSGNRVVFGAITDTGVMATFVDSQGNPVAGPFTLPLDRNRLLPLQGLAEQLLNPVQSAATHTAKTVQLAAATRAPFSVDGLLLDLLWAGGVAGEAMLCAVQSGATGAGLSIQAAAQGCSSPALKGFANLSDAGSGTAPEVQQALNFSEDVTEASCDTDVGPNCLTLPAQIVGGQQDPDPTTLSPPTSVSASDGEFSDKIRISWRAVTGATRYELYRATTSNSAGTVIGQSNGTSFDDTTAESGVSYWYGVKACNENGCSGFSAYDAGFRGEQPADTFTLLLSLGGNGQGDVSGDGSYPAGTEVNLTATPDPSSTFEGWSPSPCAASFTMPAQNLTCTATFTLKSYTVSAAAGAGGSIDPPSQTALHGQTTSFTVTLNDGYQISAVTGCNGSLNGNTYTTGEVTADCTVSASFTNLPTFTLTVSQGGNGAGTVGGGGNYPAGAEVNLTATPEDSSLFSGWSPSPCAASFAMPADNLTCTATFNLKSYTVSATAGSGGSINPPSQTVLHGQTTSFTVTPNDGYQISTVTGCNGSLNGNTYTTGEVTADCTVSASFTNLPTFTLTVSQGGNGTGTVGGGGSYPAGATVNLTANPASSSTFGGWSPSPCAASFTMPANNLTCTATFNLKSYTVIATAGSGGNINPPSQTVLHGQTTSFTVTPNDGYLVGSVSGCNGSLNGNTYITGVITAPCVVSASFTNLPTFTLALTKTGNGAGTVSGGGSYPAETTINLTATPEDSSTFEGWSPSPCAASFTMPANNLTCTATFNLKSYTVSATAGSGGNINPPSQTVTHGNTAEFTVTPNSGYQIASVTGCNGDIDGNTYTTGAITANCTVSASFTSLPTYTVSLSKTGNGDGTVDGEGSYLAGATVKLTANPASSSTFGGWSPSPCASSFSMPADNLTCTAIFNLKSYTVSATAGSGGSIDPPSQTVTHGNTANVTVTPDGGYQIDSVTGCNGSLMGNLYTTGAITANCTVSASFSLAIPSAPTGVNASDGTYTDKVQITWNAVPGASLYEVYDVGVLLGSTDATSFNDTSSFGNQPGVVYQYRVKACNGNGCSDFSAADSGYAQLSPPTSVNASDGTLIVQIEVTWNSVNWATSYEVWKSTSANGAYGYVGSSSGTSFTESVTSTFTTYYYRVKACNSSTGCSSLSTAVDSGYANDF